MQRSRVTSSLLAVLLVSLAIPSASSAQDGSAETGTAGKPVEAAEGPSARRTPRSEKVEQITVVARKREELLQETPLSIVAFGSQDLKDREVRKLEDISALVPNLDLGAAVLEGNSARISIRAVGNGDPIITADPGVGVYVDGVYLARAQGALLSVSDIASVEVLRGPQGTLYGKNTIGGAINVTTQKPGFELGGFAELRLGNYRNVESRFAVDVPLASEMAALRLSFATAADDGFVRNRFAAGRSKLQNNRLLAGRAQLLLLPTDSLELLFSYDQSKEDRAGLGTKCKATGDPNPLVVEAARQNGFDYLEECRADDARDNLEVAQDGRVEDMLRTYGASLQAIWQASDALQVKSISAWRRNKVNGSNDPDATPLPIAQDNRFDNDNGTQDFISQEFNFNWTGFDGRLNVTTGLYGAVEKNQDNERGQALPITGDMPILFPFTRTFGDPVPEGVEAAALINGAGDCISDAIVQALAPDLELDPSTCLRPFSATRTKGFLKGNVTSYAAYGEGTYDVSDKLSVTAGLRYTAERKRIARFRQIVEGQINDPAVAADPLRADRNFELSKRFGKLTPAFTLQYRLNDDLNVYARYARGFKSGGFNGRGDNAIEASDFDPEVLASYEAGVRSSWLEDRLTFNATYFQSLYEDIQLTTVTADDQNNLFIFVDNAGKASIRGLEVDAVWIPAAGLTVNGSLGITAARYKEFDGCPNCTVPFAPTYAGTLGVQYAFSVGSLGDAVASFSWSHRSETTTEVLDSRPTRSNKRGLLSGRLAFEFADGVTEIALFGSNLLNREYFDVAIDLGDSLGATLRNYAPPIRFGLEVRREF